MTTCGNQPTHQTAEEHMPLCGEHASQAKREGARVEIRPAPEPGGRRKAGAGVCGHVEPGAGPEAEPELEAESEDG